MPFWLRITLISIFALLLILWLIFRFALNMNSSPEDIAAYFENEAVKPTFKTYQYGAKTIHYADIGAVDKPTILFIHGSPGTWDAWKAYFKDKRLINDFRLIAVDRLGYGQSHREPVSSLYEQAAAFFPLLEQIPDSVAVIAVSHSFGGPVSARLAMEKPNSLAGLLIVAGLADPVYEKRLAIQSPMRKPALRWLLPPDMDASNREIVPLKQELQDMRPLWSQIKTPTVVMQGDKDMLVHKKHADFMEQALVNAPTEIIRLPAENHFTIWTQHELVVDQILRLGKGEAKWYKTLNISHMQLSISTKQTSFIQKIFHMTLPKNKAGHICPKQNLADN